MINQSKPLIIGVGGICRAGKNTFCDLLQKTLSEKGTKSIQLSFAQQLRNETSEFLDENFGLNVWDDTDKEKFRPFLVWYANLKRQSSRGLYFINKLRITMNLYKETVMLINDARFKEFEFDELDFVKENGLVVHISKYKIVGYLEDNLGNPVKVFDDPPNEFEAKNDPIIKAAADYHVCWENVGKENLDKLQPHIDNFVTWLGKGRYIK